jgi:hypothetical protein
LSQFIRLDFILIDLLQLWKEFEEEKNLFKSTILNKNNLKNKEEILKKMEILANEMDETGNNWIRNAGDFVRKQIEEFVRLKKYLFKLKNNNFDFSKQGSLWCENIFFRGFKLIF